MPTVEKDQLVYSEKESSPEICPLCGGELDYGKLEVKDSWVEYPWDCKDCKATGYEYANLVFDGHRVETATLPPAIKRVYKDASENLYFVRGGMDCTTFKGFRRWADPLEGQRREHGLHKLRYTPDKDQAQRDLDAYAVQHGLIEVKSEEEPLLNVRDIIIQNPGAVFNMMTPCGFVYLKPEQAEALLNGEPVSGHPGDPTMAMDIKAEELLTQKVFSSNYSDGVWNVLTGNPEDEIQ